MKHLNIHSMDGNIGKFALDLEIIKENSKSIYAEGMYGNVYRVVKKTGSVYIDGEKYADNSSYSIVD